MAAMSHHLSLGHSAPGLDNKKSGNMKMRRPRHLAGNGDLLQTWENNIKNVTLPHRPGKMGLPREKREGLETYPDVLNASRKPSAAAAGETPLGDVKKHSGEK